MSIDLVRLPSLDLIRGFVAVGRRMSITLAADDLCLTQSAVSRQVKSLEDLLGVKLLVRGHRSITFTTEGERLFRSADSAVQQLQDVIGTVCVTRGRRPVTVTSTIGVVGLWLLPRLGRFQKNHPGIDVRVAANNRVMDLKSEGVDLAIRYCPQSSAPEGAVRLFGETVAPVAHPSLGLQSLDSAKDIADLFLLEFDDPRRPWLGWSEWLNAIGWGQTKPKGVMRFNQYDQVIQAAIAGQGIALGRLELIGPLIADHRLVVLSTPKQSLGTDYAYWLVQVDPEPRDEVIKVFKWIKMEAQRDELLMQ